MKEFLDSIGYMSWVLPALLAIPVIGAGLIWLTPTGRRRGLAPGADESAAGVANGPRWIAVAVLVVEFIVSLGLWSSFDAIQGAWQAVFDMTWIPSWGIRFTLGIDGIAMMMILLTTSIMALSILGSWTGIRTRTHGYYTLMLILTSGMLGVFMALDLFLFYVMWEVMLVPMYFIVGIWGGERRIYASVKFFIYTMVGSMLMLVAIVYLGLAAGDPATGIPNFSYDVIMETVRVPTTIGL